MDANGVQKAVLIQHGGMYDNAYLLDCAARHNGRFSVVGMVDEASPSAPDDLAGWAERGVTGVRLTPSSPDSLWRAASEIGLTVSCRQDVAAFASGQFADLMAGLPEPIPVVAEHFAGATANMEEPYEAVRPGPRNRAAAQRLRQARRSRRNQPPPSDPRRRLPLRPYSPVRRDDPRSLRPQAHDVGQRLPRRSATARATATPFAPSWTTPCSATRRTATGSWAAPHPAFSGSCRRMSQHRLLTDDLNAFASLDVHVPGAPDGPLSGLTFAAKDIFDVAGHVTGGGNPDWERTHGPAECTAPTVQMLLDAGATLVGKTHTDELTRGIMGTNPHYGTPVEPRRSGPRSGRIVQRLGFCRRGRGVVDFALGSDTGGSVRMPASFCGLYGLRPTHGRISLEGVLPQAASFDTVGWFARDAATFERVGRVLLQSTSQGAMPDRSGDCGGPLRGAREQRPRRAQIACRRHYRWDGQ